MGHFYDVWGTIILEKSRRNTPLAFYGKINTKPHMMWVMVWNNMKASKLHFWVNNYFNH